MKLAYRSKAKIKLLLRGTISIVIQVHLTILYDSNKEFLHCLELISTNVAFFTHVYTN